MGLLGSILFLFIVRHMSDIWYNYKYSGKVGFVEYKTDLATDKTTAVPYNPVSPDFEKSVSVVNNIEIVRVKDLHARVASSFSNLIYVIFYVIAMGAVSFHLLHGFQSAFQSVGINHPVYTPIIKSVGNAFSLIVPLVFAAMPIAMHLGWIK